MAPFSYVVRCAFRDGETMTSFLSWLRDRHLADVCAAGAQDADLVVLDPVQTPPAQQPHPHMIEVRYRFDTRQAFERYEREEAPRLRAEGLAELARIGVESTAVTMTRTTGEHIAWRS